MANIKVEFVAPNGVGPLTLKLFTLGTETEVATATATEKTNRKQLYAATVTVALSGVHHALAVDATGFPYASGFVDMADDNDIHRVESSYALATAAPTIARMTNQIPLTWTAALAFNTATGLNATSTRSSPTLVGAVSGL